MDDNSMKSVADRMLVQVLKFGGASMDVSRLPLSNPAPVEPRNEEANRPGSSQSATSVKQQTKELFAFPAETQVQQVVSSFERSQGDSSALEDRSTPTAQPALPQLPVLRRRKGMNPLRPENLRSNTGKEAESLIPQAGPVSYNREKDPESSSSARLPGSNASQSRDKAVPPNRPAGEPRLGGRKSLKPYMNLSTLPTEIHLEIADHLNIEDIVSLGMTNRSLIENVGKIPLKVIDPQRKVRRDTESLIARHGTPEAQTLLDSILEQISCIRPRDRDSSVERLSQAYTNAPDNNARQASALKLWSHIKEMRDYTDGLDRALKAFNPEHVPSDRRSEVWSEMFELLDKQVYEFALPYQNDDGDSYVNLESVASALPENQPYSVECAFKLLKIVDRFLEQDEGQPQQMRLNKGIISYTSIYKMQRLMEIARTNAPDGRVYATPGEN